MHLNLHRVQIGCYFGDFLHFAGLSLQPPEFSEFLFFLSELFFEFDLALDSAGLDFFGEVLPDYCYIGNVKSFI